jgi:hypothetical protein
MPTAYLVFHAPVNPITAQHFIATCANLVNQGNNELYLCYLHQEEKLHQE